MKNFFRDGIDIITKFIVTQLGMTMFGLMVTMATRALPGASEEKSDPMLLVVSLFAIGLYLFLLYTHIWEKGAKDKIKIDGGRMKQQKLKGLYLSLVANSINIILGIVMWVSYCSCDFVKQPDSIACQIFGTANDIARLIQGMYTGTIIYFSPDAVNTPPYVFLLIVVPALAVSAFGYFMGVTNRRIIKSGKNKAQ